MSQRLYISYLLYWCMHYAALAQELPLDSLRSLLEAAPRDTNKVILYNRYVRRLAFTNLTAALHHAPQALSLAKELRYPLGEGVAYYHLGMIYDLQANIMPALENALMAARLFTALKDKPNLASTYNLLGTLYRRQEDWQASLQYYTQSLSIREQLHDERNMGAVLNNIAGIYDLQEKYALALEYHQRALKIKQKIQDKIGYGHSLLNISILHIKQQELSQAQDYINQSLTVFEAQKDLRGQMLCHGAFAKLAAKRKDWNEVITQGEQSIQLARQYHNMPFIKDIGELLAEGYAQLGNFSQAYYWANTSNKYRDSLSKESDIKLAERLKFKYELDLKQKETFFLQQSRQYQIAENERLRLQQEIYLSDYRVQEVQKNNLLFERAILDKDRQKRKAENDRLLQERESLAKERALQDTLIRQQRIAGLIIALALILAIISIWVMYRTNRRQHETNTLLNQQKEEIRQQNEAIHEQNLKLEGLNALKDRLFSVISHDYRSPLNSLQGLLSLLNNDLLSPDDTRKIAGELTNKVGITLDMLDNLLHWAKSQMNGIQMNLEEVDIKGIVAENIRLLDQVAQRKNVDIIDEVPDEMLAYADTNLVNIIIRNLLNNALKFTNHGGSVRVYVRSEGDKIYVCVADTGIGMDAETQEKIFTHRLSHTTLGTNNEKGTGLGLQLCQDFVAMLGGSFHINSTPNVGSTFTFSLTKSPMQA